jgi:ribosomal protein S18 acetylase RimI-like enzyme
LIKFVEDSSRKGQEAVFLNVNKNNPAIKFYERMNYKVSNQIVINIGNGYVMDDYIMEKKLV